MACAYTDCVHYRDHLACLDCWRGKGLRDGYEPTLPYSLQGRLCNLLGQVWEEYCLGGLSKRHAVRILALIQQLQVLLMEETLASN